MALGPGTRLGAYEILTLLGAGGMGEVYKARDTRLDRVVAIKVLPATLATDSQFRERFDREARTISKLDHPHICSLHDIGDHEGTAFLVLQYLEGETLDVRMQRGALKLDEALRIAIQIADALDRAHRAGVVHRDLKPANVMLTKSGAKLLDFGLAKTAAPAVTAAGATMTPTAANLTAQGTILGTWQYMAPEQIEGRDADVRTDIFSFGAMLYEMVTGRTAFAAKSHASLIAAILERHPPPIGSLLPLAPPMLDHIVAKCLAKDPDDRWQSASDLMSELTWIAGSGATSSAGAAPAARRLQTSRIRVVLAAAAGLAVGVAATAWLAGRMAPAPSPEVTRALIGTSPSERVQALAADFTTNEGRPSRTAMVWSPDGRTIVFSGAQGGHQQLYSRALDRLEATPIVGTDGASNPFFSLDGRWLGFWSNDALRKISMPGGGPATVIAEAPAGIFGASWGSDDTIVFSKARDGLWRVPGAGGAPQRLTKPDAKNGELKHLLPQMLPGSGAVIFTLTHSPLPTWDDTQIVALSLSTGERRVLVQSGADARYAASGHLVYLRRGTLMAAPFDVRRLKITGGAIGVVADVMQAANTTNEAFESGAGQFAVSETGSLLHVPGGISPDPERSLVWVDRNGTVSALSPATRAFMSPRLSPDGQRITLWTQGDRSIWVYDLSRGVLTRVTSEGRNARAVWTPDGTRLAYGSATTGDEELVWKSAEGGGPVEHLCDCHSVPAAWSPDGRTLTVVTNAAGSAAAGDSDIDVLSLDNRTLRPFVHTRFFEGYPDISPDGHWIAYASNESGRLEVYVQSFPNGGPRYQVSSDGGTAPAWSRNGRELFYTTAATTGGQAALTKMMAVPVRIESTFSAGTPHMLFEGRYGATALIRGYDVTADGRRFLMVQQKERPPTVASQMVLAQNWIEELKRKVPAK